MLQNARLVRVEYRDKDGQTGLYHIELTGSPFWGRSADVAREGWLINGTDLDNQMARVWALAEMRPVSDD